jgi:hypothetical protein
MLHPLVLPTGLVEAAEPLAPPSAASLRPGRRVLAKLPHWRLYEAAEVVRADAASASTTVVFLSRAQRTQVALADVAVSAHCAADAGGGTPNDGSDERAGASGASSSSSSSSSGSGDGDEGGSSSASDTDSASVSGEARGSEEEDHLGLGLGDVMAQARCGALPELGVAGYG